MVREAVSDPLIRASSETGAPSLNHCQVTGPVARTVAEKVVEPPRSTERATG